MGADIQVSRDPSIWGSPTTSTDNSKIEQPVVSTMSRYVIPLSDGCFYVGVSKDVRRRYEEHRNGLGPDWTKLHRPVGTFRDVEIEPVRSPYDEDNKVKELMMTYGTDKVRGGSYVTPILKDGEISLLNKEIRTANNLCFKCGKGGHYAKLCREDRPQHMTIILSIGDRYVKVPNRYTCLYNKHHSHPNIRWVKTDEMDLDSTIRCFRELQGLVVLVRWMSETLVDGMRLSVNVGDKFSCDMMEYIDMKRIALVLVCANGTMNRTNLSLSSSAIKYNIDLLTRSSLGYTISPSNHQCINMHQFFETLLSSSLDTVSASGMSSIRLSAIGEHKMEDSNSLYSRSQLVCDRGKEYVDVIVVRGEERTPIRLYPKCSIVLRTPHWGDNSYILCGEKQFQISDGGVHHV
jgi:predicted GIY-YIG superfamily endonuclease